jgi:hypothetical protein
MTGPFAGFAERAEKHSLTLNTWTRLFPESAT